MIKKLTIWVACLSLLAGVVIGFFGIKQPIELGEKPVGAITATTIVKKQSIELSDKETKLETIKTDIDSQAESLTVRISRPTTANPLAWDESSTMKVNIILEVDGVEHRATGQATGGIRLNEGIEVAEYTLSYTPTWGFFGARGGTTKRLGETKTSTYTARVELELLSGSISTDIEMTYTTASAPDVPFHNSVAFDVATDGQEATGDGVITISHTATGSNLAAFVGVGNRDTAGSLGATTYDGVAMTEMWDSVYEANVAHAGYRLAGISSGAKSVVNTLVNTTPTTHVVGVITMTGVHQSTPVGTAVTAASTGIQPTVTVASVGTNDLVVDSIFSNIVTTTTEGADQTVRYTENIDTDQFRGSTQLGSAGGVMSWTVDDVFDPWGLGAVAFKPAPGTVALTGTVASTINESDIVTGGKTIILTATNDTFIANSIVTPVIESGDVTLSGSNTAEDPWAVSYPNAVAGDLLIFFIGWDDSTATADVAEPAGPNSEVLSEINATPITDSGTTVRGKGWYTIATDTWTANTLSFNPDASEQWSAMVVRVPAGEFDAADPIGEVGTVAGGSDTQVDSPTFTAGASDGDGRLIWFATVNVDPLSATPPTSWSITQRRDIGAVATGIATRDAAVTDSESIASASWTIAGDTWASFATVVRAPTATAFESARQGIIDGIDSGQNEGTGWDAVVKAGQTVGGVVRTSDTVVTITLDAFASYNITAQETITATVPAAALTGAGAIVAAPTFTVDVVAVGGGPPEGEDVIIIQ